MSSGLPKRLLLFGASILCLAAAGSGVAFLLAPTSPSGNAPVAVALADFDGDKKLDAVVANSKDGTIGVLLGKGNSTFATQVTFAVGANPVALVVGDFNGDGKPDVAVVSAGSSGNPSVTVLLNTGSGPGNVTFSSASYPLPSTSVPTAIAMGNLNTAIGPPDLVVANGTAGGVSVLLNNGNGTFGTATTVAGGSNTVAVAVADFNIDTHPDIAVADAANANVDIIPSLGTSPATFGPAVPIVLPPGKVTTVPSAIISGDFAYNGKPDVAVADSANSRVIILLNTSAGAVPAFGKSSINDVELMPVALTTGDVRSNGSLDIITANKTSRSVSVLLNLNSSTNPGTFAVKANWAMGPDPVSVAVGDIGFIDGTNDGRLDIVTANMSGNSVSGLLGIGNGIFYGPRNYKVGQDPVSIFAGGIATPGEFDIAVADHDSNDMSILFNTNTGAFNDYFTPASPPTEPTDMGPRGILIGNFHPGGGADVATANDANDITINSFKNGGTFSFTGNFALPAGTVGPRGVAGGFFSGNGKQDMAVPDFTGDSSGNNATVFLQGNSNNNMVILQPPVNYMAHTNPMAVATGDFNGDGNIDIAIANNGSNDVSILPGNGNGTFGAPQNFAVGKKPVAIAVGDFNGDGMPDLAIANNSDNTVTVLLNTTPANSGIFSFTVNGPYAVSTNPLEIRAIDVNHDGILDLVVGSNDPKGKDLNVLLGNGKSGKGDGTFQATQMFVIGNAPTSVASGDFNADSAADMVFSNGLGDDVTVVLNEGGNTTNLNASLTPPGTNIFSYTLTGTITPTVPQINVPTGMVTFTDNVLRLGNGPQNLSPTVTVTPGAPISTKITPGIATQTYTLTGGTQVISGSYTGDNVFNANTFNSVTINVGFPVTCVINSSADPVFIGQSVIYTVTINSTNGTPSGSVTFSDNGTTTMATLANGVATLMQTYTTGANVGNHTITVTYLGDATHQGCTAGPFTEHVIKAPTAVTLTSSLNPSFRLQSVTFTATVTTNFGTPAGSVTFFAGATNLGTLPLNASNQAQLTTANLPAGNNLMSAQYVPSDTIHGGSTSPTLVQVVNLNPSTTKLVSSVNPAVVPINTTLTFTATVTGSVAGVAPTGTVQFFDFGTSIGSGPLSAISPSSSQATLALNIPAQLAVGAHLITAVFPADANYANSTSAILGQVVENSTQSATTNTLTIVPFPVASFRICAQKVALTATLTSGAGTPTGSVTFYDGNTALGTVSLVSGVATLKVGPNSSPTLARGLRQITAVYDGTTVGIPPTFAPSISATETLERTVKPR